MNAQDACRRAFHLPHMGNQLIDSVDHLDTFLVVSLSHL